MAKSDDFFDLLRSHGLRKKVAKPLSALDGNGRKSGAAGEKLARQTVDDLTAAADAIRKRVLKRDHTRSQAARKAAQTRKRNTAKRVSSAPARCKHAGQSGTDQGGGEEADQVSPLVLCAPNRLVGRRDLGGRVHGPLSPPPV